jgi:subtilisin family serine protease
VPLRFPRPVLALIATGAAAISIGLSTVPASADQVRHEEWWLGSLGVTGAWTASQGSGVTVAVLSDGVDARHADLAGAVTTAPAPAGAPVASGQYLGAQGTPIASLIAGRGHGSGGTAGIVGVAPKAQILSVPVTLPPDDPQLSQSSVAAAIPAAIAAGIRYAVRHGATVIDLPIDPGQAGSTGTGGATAAAGGSAAEQSAVSYALAHNVVLVAPAGDDEAAGDARNYPAAYQGVIAVGAFDSAFNKAPWSSHQSYVTLTAAGANVVASASTGGYETMNSTSAASAVVAGVAALIRSRYPSLTVAEVRQAMITSTKYRRAGGLADGSGYGAVNAGQAMSAAAALTAPPADRASSGAQPRQALAPVPAGSAAQGIAAQVVRAGEVSGGLLLLLLLLIAAYAATGRRRSSRQPAVAAEWTHRHGQSRYPQAGNADADRMLELFGAPAPPELEAYGAQPVGTGWADAGSRSERAGWADSDDEGLFAPAAGRQPASATAGHGAPAGPVAPGADGGRWLSHGPASRAVSRRAPVSGAPPWEPAAAPDSELPWTAATPGRHAGVAPPARALPAGSQPTPALPAAAQPAAGHHAAGDPTPTALPPRPVQSDWAAPDRTSQPGWDRAARASQADREIPGRGFASPAGTGSPSDFGPPSEFGPPSDFGPPSEFGAPGDFGSPASVGSASGFGSATGRSATDDFGYPNDTASAADWNSELDGPSLPRVAPSGLPVRPARATRPASPAPLSPSGSLWEPVESDTASEPPAYTGEAQDATGRPIFVWDPATPPESYPTRHAGSRDISAERSGPANQDW